MIGQGKSLWLWFLGQFFRTVGCCYHAQHFGRSRDIGIGEIGCDTCGPCHGGGGCREWYRQDRRQSRGHTAGAKESSRDNSVLPVTYRESGRGVLAGCATRSAAADRKLPPRGSPFMCCRPTASPRDTSSNPHPVQTMAPAPAQKTAAQEIPIPAVPNDHE